MGAALRTRRPSSGSGVRPVEQGQIEDDVEDVRCRFLPPDAESTTMLTWNVAAVNNNPFEYWIDYDDPIYQELMQGVECFLDDPAENDVEVKDVFTYEMFRELKALCEEENMEGLDEMEEKMWLGGDLRLAHRRIVSEFIKDKGLGSKRLISMPDRVTNTINVVTRTESSYRPPPACRPCVINNYEGDLSSVEVWWDSWKRFMFKDSMAVRSSVATIVQRPVEMLEQIPRSKYPAVSEDEERLAIPLQLVCLAIFDAVIIYFMNLLSRDCMWQNVKAKICSTLYRHKHQMTMDILSRRYGAVDVICLQEVAAVFKDTFSDSKLSKTHALSLPMKLDGKRDQNSLIMLRKEAFRIPTVFEVTSFIASFFPSELKLADGDLLAVEAEHARDGRRYLIISFHGDTNGLLTVPLVRAVDAAVRQRFTSHVVLLCLDANVYETPKDGRKLFKEFISDVRQLGLTTCFGDDPDVSVCRTTCSSRTSLQPQLNKAVRHADMIAKSDMNPKDMILFYQSQASMLDASQMGRSRQSNPQKDNTGRMFYKENSIFPTLHFPSDHGIVALALSVHA